MPVETSSSAEKIWNEAKSIIRAEVSLQNYNTWFRSSNGVFLDDNVLKISVPNKFTADWLMSKFNVIVADSITSCLGSPRKVEYVVNSSGENSESIDTSENINIPPSTAVPEKKPVPDVLKFESHLNSRYLFDSFVVGDSNQFAYAAAKAVSEAPMETKYNPLYIYGRSGLGKTHLVQAIGNEVKNNFSTLKVLYVTSEKFTNDFIDSIAHKKTLEFAKFYRSVDLLLLDDIQFFTGKEATQEQFFHTFNTLYQSGKQIVLTSDRPPREIKGLEERLLSRFQCGLVTDIQPPELETRTAILNQIVKSQGLSIPPDVIAYIAGNITKNIRELEGSIIRILAYGSLTGKEININLAYEVLRDAFTSNKTISVESITNVVSDYFKIDKDLIKSKRKTAELVRARQIAMFLCRKYTSVSLKTIGDKFGGRDHSTVIHAINSIENSFDIDFSIKSAIDSIEISLKS